MWKSVMMKMQYVNVGGSPAVLYGERTDKVLVYIHGKYGSGEEALEPAEFLCPNGWQVLGLDLPEHGRRKDDGSRLLPWETVPALRAALAEIRRSWSRISLLAVSIGAYMSLCSFADEKFEQCLFVSPVLDMHDLIEKMMAAAGVSPERLAAEKMIPCGEEILSWDYYRYTMEHPVERWDSPTAILRAERDALVSRESVDAFVRRFGCSLCICEKGEHWFHTPKQLAARAEWIRSLLL